MEEFEGLKVPEQKLLDQESCCNAHLRTDTCDIVPCSTCLFDPLHESAFERWIASDVVDTETTHRFNSPHAMSVELEENGIRAGHTYIVEVKND